MCVCVLLHLDDLLQGFHVVFLRFYDFLDNEHALLRPYGEQPLPARKDGAASVHFHLSIAQETALVITSSSNGGRGRGSPSC